MDKINITNSRYMIILLCAALLGLGMRHPKRVGRLIGMLEIANHDMGEC